MQTVPKKIYAFNFTAERDLNSLFNTYIARQGSDLSRLKERGLLYEPQTGRYSYFLRLEKLIKKDKFNNDFIIFKGRIYQIRSTDLPLILNTFTGDTRGLILQNRDSLAEITHFIFIPKLNLILSEYNHTGARIEKLKSILDYTLNLNSFDMDIKPILRKDNYKTVINCGDLKELSFKVGHLGYKSIDDVIGINMFEDLNSVFSELSDFDIELKFTAKNKKILHTNDKNSLLSKLSILAKKVMDSKENNTYSDENIKKLSLKHYEGKTSIPLDLLEDKLVQITKITKIDDNYKYVDSDDMFKKLIELYSKNIFKLDRFEEIFE
ncbi:hypothetical protein [Clostridium paraputrificum]|uniref:hypothetical protein n=1 Tax=Clostridium paraputrificum TaxID=29363 RepID=UPI0034A4FF77